MKQVDVCYRRLTYENDILSYGLAVFCRRATIVQNSTADGICWVVST